MVATLTLAVFVVWCFGLSTAENVTECDPSHHLDLKISIFSRRNKTGQLIAQVKLEDGSGEDFWQVDIGGSAFKRWNPQPLVSSNGDIPTKTSEPPRPFYELIPGLGYYKLHNFPRTWHEALIICEKEGAHLGIINSQREAEVLKELRSRVPKVYNDWRDDVIFIGLNDINSENSWVTISDTPLSETGYSLWDTSEPSGGANENCLVIMANSGKLRDTGCSSLFAFLCEREL